MADSDSAAKIDTTGTKTVKRLDLLTPETPIRGGEFLTTESRRICGE